MKKRGGKLIKKSISQYTFGYTDQENTIIPRLNYKDTHTFAITDHCVFYKIRRQYSLIMEVSGMEKCSLTQWYFAFHIWIEEIRKHKQGSPKYRSNKIDRLGERHTLKKKTSYPSLTLNGGHLPS